MNDGDNEEELQCEYMGIGQDETRHHTERETVQDEKRIESGQNTRSFCSLSPFVI